MSSGTVIRPFSAEDYAAVLGVENRVYPEYNESVEEWRHADSARDPKIRWGRFVAERRDTVVGYGGFGQSESMYHPRKFNLSLSVVAEHRRQGVGGELYEAIVDALRPFDPLVVYASAREDHQEGVRFLTKRGFTEVMREWENHLDVVAFDAAPFQGVVERVEASGITLTSLQALERDPDREAKLFDLVAEVNRDVPAPDERTPFSFEAWRERTFNHPNLLPAGYFVALDGDLYVGLSALWASPGTTDLYTGLTGTRRAYRRRGIALALKLLAIDYARQAGVKTIRTWNATGNVGMLAINEALGFRRQPAWIELALEEPG